MDEKDKTKAAVPTAEKGVRATLSAHEPTEGTDCWITFDGFSAEVTGINGGGLAAAKLERKVLGITVKQSTPSHVAEVRDMKITFERGTGDIPALRTKGTLVYYDANAQKKKTYANAVLYDTGDIKAESGVSEGELTFLLNELPTEEAWTATLSSVRLTGYSA